MNITYIEESPTALEWYQKFTRFTEAIAADVSSYDVNSQVGTLCFSVTVRDIGTFECRADWCNESPKSAFVDLLTMIATCLQKGVS